MKYWYAPMSLSKDELKTDRNDYFKKWVKVNEKLTVPEDLFVEMRLQLKQMLNKVVKNETIKTPAKKATQT